MDNINKRLRELRKACGKNQTEFGHVLGISPSGIADIENERRNVTEKHLVMLSNWGEYNVNIEWLRTGEGEMFLPSETDVLEKIRQDYHLTDRQLRFVSNFLRMPENEKDVIFNFLSSVFADDSGNMETKIQRELEAYRAELEPDARHADMPSTSNAPEGSLGKEAR